MIVESQKKSAPLRLLSHFQAKAMRIAKKSGETELEVSLDLNLSKSDVSLTEEGVRLPEGQTLNWEQILEIEKHPNACFQILEGRKLGRTENEMEKVAFYSGQFKRSYALFPTEKTPAMLLSGIPMHRVKEIDPMESSLRMVRAIQPIFGDVLDTTTGLGYVTIGAAQTATRVVTIELDPAVIEVCRRNPWSQGLFTNPKIDQRIGSCEDVIQTLPDSSFNRIFHDPPTYQLSGELYSEIFYRQLYRVMKKGGRLFHYVGDLRSPQGHSVSKGATIRLQNVGFTLVKRNQEAYGLTAVKER